MFSLPATPITAFTYDAANRPKPSPMAAPGCAP